MKISLLTDGIFPYVIGGMQKHSFYLVKYFAKRGIYIDLYHTNQSKLDIDKLEFFSEEEKSTISAITEKFANISSWDIVELSHQEKAWKELEASKQLIKYQDYAFELTAL